MYSINELLEEIAKANEDEQEAIAKYMHLLEVIENTQEISSATSNHLYKDVREYIAEELKHSKGLHNYFCEISEITPEK